ncbi:hypothetical protein RIF29_38458 [Crotalaria pallida]|uniref:Uncharacterized protein n=1 Tax=Crotalaria pallida TaxID=3830 RepID=A0AAN9E074_CROPI
MVPNPTTASRVRNWDCVLISIRKEGFSLSQMVVREMRVDDAAMSEDGDEQLQCMATIATTVVTCTTVVNRHFPRRRQLSLTKWEGLVA